MNKIAIVSKNLKVGGIQKSLINLLKKIDYKKYKVDFYLYDDKFFFKDEIPSKVNLIILKKRISIIKLMPFNFIKMFCSSKLKGEYDCVIDYDGYQTDTALEVILSNAKHKIYWIHQNLFMKAKEEKKYWLLHIFMKSKYKFYNKFVAVSKGIVEPFEKLNKIAIKDITTIIPNFIDTKLIFEKSKEACDLVIDENKYNFVSLGRICRAKGYDILINYLKMLTEYRKDFHFYLIGDGEERKKIEKQIKKLKLNKYITLLGNQLNPFKYLKLMDGFVLTSRYEGQGMVILEALALGLEIFIPKELEKYNEDIVGCNNILDSMKNAKRRTKTKNNLNYYNEHVKVKIERLLSKI